jgi:dissimilatory sulfite reductase related protein
MSSNCGSECDCYVAVTEREVAGKTLGFDAGGFMVDASQWSREVAAALAKEDGIDELTARHYMVIDFMRKEVEEKGSAPTIRRLTKQSGVPTKELYALFPGGPAKKAARIAGLKKPEGCV